MVIVVTIIAIGILTVISTIIAAAMMMLFLDNTPGISYQDQEPN